MEYAISKSVLLAIVLAPLLGAIVAGLFGRRIGRAGAHAATGSGTAVKDADVFHAFRKDVTLLHARTTLSLVAGIAALLGLAPQQQGQPQVSGAQPQFGQQTNTQGAYTQGAFANNPFEQFGGGASKTGSMFDGSTMGPLMARNMRMLDRGMSEGGLISQPRVQQPQQQAAAPAQTPQQLQQSAFAQWRSTPGYQFNLDEGRKQLESSAAARGGLYSGAALKSKRRVTLRLQLVMPSAAARGTARGASPR